MQKTLSFDEFPQKTYDDWLEKLQKDLKNDSIVDTINSAGRDGIPLKILYQNAKKHIWLGPKSIKPEFFKANEWYINQTFILGKKNEKELNKEILAFLENGCNAITFLCKKSGIRWSELLQNIQTEYIQLKVVDYSENSDLEGELKSYFDCIHKSSDKIYLRRSVENMLLKGQPIQNFSLKEAQISIDGSIFKNSGASISQEIAYVLTWINELFHENLEKKPFHFQLNMGIGEDLILEISKLKALKHLIRKLEIAYDVENTWHISAENSTFNYSNKETEINILRASSACVAAAIGGVNEVFLHPYQLGANAFSSRMYAQNIQHLCNEESKLGEVYDAFSGSEHIENASKNLVSESWKLFLEIEEKGGFKEYFNSGKMAADIQRSYEAKKDELQNKKVIKIGINAFRNNQLQTQEIGNFEMEVASANEHRAISPKRIEKDLPA